MKKKETLWQLLKRLDEEAGQVNFYLHKANHYFDHSATTTNKVLEQHERELHKLIREIKKPLKSFLKQMKKRKKSNNK